LFICALWDLISLVNANPSGAQYSIPGIALASERRCICGYQLFISDYLSADGHLPTGNDIQDRVVRD
jgi:hypothetical protein